MQLSEQKINEIYKSVYKKYKEKGIERFNHILGVVKMATYLAQEYGVSKEKAEVAALLHDYYKYESIEEMKSYLNEPSDLEKCEQCNVLYHAYCSAKAAKEVFNITDEEIISAIKNHVYGKINMSKLDEIILISDYTEEGRQYPDCIKCREILLSGKMDEAIYLSTKNTIEFVRDRNLKVMPEQEEILLKYKEKAKL